MKQKTLIVTFDSSTDISIDDALIAAKESFPGEKFNGIKTSEELVEKLGQMEQTLYVKIDPEKQNRRALESEVQLKKAIDELVDSFQCELPPISISAEDLADTDFCETPEEFPPTPDIELGEISDLEKLLADIDEKGKADVKDVLDCVNKIGGLTDDIKALNEKGGRVNNTLINLEEFLYNYSLMDYYYKKRLTTLNQVLGIFDPLLELQREYEFQIDLLTPLNNDAGQDLNDAIQRLKNQSPGFSGASGISGASGFPPNVPSGSSGISGASGSSGISGFSGNSGTPQVETLEHVRQLQTAYDTYHAQLLDYQAKLQDTLDKINFETGKISPFLKEIDFEKGTNFGTGGNSTFGSLTQSEQEAARLQWLQDNLSGLFAGGSTAFQRVTSFSTRCILKQNENPGTNQSYLLTIEHTLIDDENLLAGRPKTFMVSGPEIQIDPAQVNVTPHGTLYDQFYNIWGDTDLFFSREERGLTSDSNFVAAELKGTGAEVFKSNFISDSEKFKDFYSNYGQRHAAKTVEVKTNIIQPAINQIIGDLEDLALKEVEYLLAFGKAFELLPGESTKLTDLITAIRQSSEAYSGRVNELKQALAFVQLTYAGILSQVEAKKQQIPNVPCAAHTAPPPSEKEPNPPGADPLGANTIQESFPEDPDPTKWCYWLKFAAMATAVNILPIPGAGGFKYWPIGLQIPNPSGITNIPLPIIWLPIAVIVLPVGIFVIFIGLCGICPSPFVFFIGPDGQKKFIISLRPTDEFGANSGDDLLKTVLKGGITVKVPMVTLLNAPKIPDFKAIFDIDGASTVLADVKDKIFKKVNKLELPDITPITSKLTTGSAVAEKKKALKEIIHKSFDKVVLPTIKIPKNGSKNNPKLPPVSELIAELNKLAKMKLPLIAIPSIATINLKDKVTVKINNLLPDGFPTIPPIPIPDFGTALPEEIEEFKKKTKDALKKGLEFALKKLAVPKEFGLLKSVVAGGVTFINPYKCKPGATGLSIPPIPGGIIAALTALKIAADALIDKITLDVLKNLLTGINQLTAALIPNVLNGILKALPDFVVPDPSKISIKDMLKDAMKSIAKMQIPTLPDPTKPPQIQIPIPGEAIKAALAGVLDAAIDKFPINDIDFSKIMPTDVKQILITILEESMKPVEDILKPILTAIAIFQAAKDKTFPETLGLKKPLIKIDASLVPVVLEAALAAAFLILKGLALVPYPAVAFAPELFKKLHPMLESDDLPPWQRLSLSNFLFIYFLDQFCTQGKKGGGFLENP